MCTKDVSPLHSTLDGPDSPRKHSEPLRPTNDKEGWFVAFDGPFPEIVEDTESDGGP